MNMGMDSYKEMAIEMKIDIDRNININMDMKLIASSSQN